MKFEELPEYRLPRRNQRDPDPEVASFYRARRSGNLGQAKEFLRSISVYGSARMAILLLELELLEQSVLPDVAMELCTTLCKSCEDGPNYIDYGIGLSQMWRGAFEAAAESFLLCEAHWRSGSSYHIARGGLAFTLLQRAICRAASGKYSESLLLFDKCCEASFPPLARGEQFLRDIGGLELALEPRMPGSRELKHFVDFWKLLVTFGAREGQVDAVNGPLLLTILKREATDDLLLQWYAAYISRMLDDTDRTFECELYARTINGCKGLFHHLRIIEEMLIRYKKLNGPLFPVKSP